MRTVAGMIERDGQLEKFQLDLLKLEQSNQREILEVRRSTDPYPHSHVSKRHQSELFPSTSVTSTRQSLRGGKKGDAHNGAT